MSKKETRRMQEEAPWMASERAYSARLAEQKCREFHEAQARRLRATLGVLVAHHEAEAAKYTARDRKEK